MNPIKLYLRKLEQDDAQALLQLKSRNCAFFQPFDPIRDESLYAITMEEGSPELRL